MHKASSSPLLVDLSGMALAGRGRTVQAGSAVEITGRHEPLRKPHISVVIPSRNRRVLVERALHSVLCQTFRDLEVLVVIDGPDMDTQDALSRIEDARLRLFCLEHGVGGSEARNLGVRYAKGSWIAFLDDDDEWMPEKLEKQLQAAESTEGSLIFVASRFVERTESAQRILPRRLPLAGEAFSDYLFTRRGWNSGEGFLQTSTWFVSRELMRRVPFTPGLRRCQDLDWLLHATALPEVSVVVVPEVLATFNHEDHGERVSRSADWKFLYDWATVNRRYFTSRAFSFFLATFCVPSAAKQQEGLGTFFFLSGRCIFAGSPTWKCISLLLICWGVSEGRRRSLRAFIAKLAGRLPRRLPSGMREAVTGRVS